MLLPALTVAAIILSSDLPTDARFFDIPSGPANISLSDLLHGLKVDHFSFEADQQLVGLTTHAVHGIFTPCDAFRHMTAGLNVLIRADEEKPRVLCAPPPAPHKPRPHRIDAAPIIDPPVRQRCERCLEISGIPVPICEDDQAKFFIDHECDK